MTVNYYLDTTSSAILLVVGHKGRKFRVSTGHVIKPITQWNKKDQRVKSAFKNYETINSELESLEGRVKKIISDYKVLKNTPPSLEYVKGQIKVDPNAEKDKTFPKMLEKFLEQSKENNKLGTYRDYKYTIDCLKKFQKKERLTVHFDNLNSDTIEKYKKYLRKNNNSPYTVKKKLHLVKIFLNYGIRNNYLDGYNESFFEMKAPVSIGDKIYLTDSEISGLEKLTDLDAADEKIRDCFLFQCYTGLRYSDLKTLKHVNVKNGHITLVMHKTSQAIYIPLSKKAIALLEKYKENDKYCLPVMSKNKCNEQIKVLCEQAKIKEEMPIVRYQGTERIDESFPKHELVATHTGRRTFATNFILNGGKIEILSKLLGHSDIRVTQRYFKDTPEIIAALAKNYI